MRSFQKKLMVTAASAAMAAFVGVAWAQSTDGTTASPSTDSSQATTGNNMSGDAMTVPSTTSDGSTVNSTDGSSATAPSSPDTSVNTTPATSSDDASGSSSTEMSTDTSTDSSSDSSLAPRADRN